MISYRDLLKDRKIFYYIERADYFLKNMGYTYHGTKHVVWVASRARMILDRLNYPEREVELAGIAGLLHDIGNIVSRHDHAQAGALLTYQLLKDKNLLTEEDLTDLMYAIGNHESATGVPVTPIAAAVVIADKSHVSRNRVRKDSNIKEDIHDRVNFSIFYSDIEVNPDKKTIKLVLKMDTSISDILEFFSIFKERMEMCRRASRVLDCKFRIKINGKDL
ncbi:HD domain-containing protein [Desulfurobacterium sp. TC5-1]|uniref:HD domain-containing protein n=1 Tax=Desulfurobacterium sp. TC5-1 TaxID=1158318 RepID=UPI0003B6D22A|nr:HD domain-containing protein [Desulfurobacterium sp. TC5-1]